MVVIPASVRSDVSIQTIANHSMVSICHNLKFGHHIFKCVVLLDDYNQHSRRFEIPFSSLFIRESDHLLLSSTTHGKENLRSRVSKAYAIENQSKNSQRQLDENQIIRSRRNSTENRRGNYFRSVSNGRNDRWIKGCLDISHVDRDHLQYLSNRRNSDMSCLCLFLSILSEQTKCSSAWSEIENGGKSR